VAGFLDKKLWSIIQGQNCLKQLRDRPLHWETVVADFLATFQSSLQLVNFNNAKQILPQWVLMSLKDCARQIWEARKKGRRGNN